MKVINRILTVLTIITLVFALTACGGGTKGGTEASSKAVSVEKQALGAVDAYLDGNASYDDTKNIIDSLCEQMEYVDEMKDGDEHYPADLYVQIDVLDLSTKLLFDKMDGNSKSYDDLVKSRNKIAENIGEKAR